MPLDNDDIPPERAFQFDAIASASVETLDWAAAHSVPLQYIYPVVPFVETDFSLEAWFFFDTEHQVRRFAEDGTCERVFAQFRADLAGAGYRSEWIPLVTCRCASKEVVDRDYQGSYYNFLR